MDLSFARFDRGTTITALPTDLAVLLAAATGRQAATATARLQTRLAWKRAPASLLNPVDGAFSGWTAALLQACVANEQRSGVNDDTGAQRMKTMFTLPF